MCAGRHHASPPSDYLDSRMHAVPHPEIGHCSWSRCPIRCTLDTGIRAHPAQEGHTLLTEGQFSTKLGEMSTDIGRSAPPPRSGVRSMGVVAWLRLVRV